MLISLIIGTTASASWWSNLFNKEQNLGAIVLNSNQVGNTPVNGLYLKTDGTVSTWSVVTATADLSLNQLGQIGDVTTTTPMTYGQVLRYNTATSEWESVATSTLGIIASSIAGGTEGMLTSWASASSLTATGTPGFASLIATSTTATSTFAGALTVNNQLLIGTTTPASGSKLLVNGSLTINMNAADPSANLSTTGLSLRGADNSATRLAISSYGVGGTGSFANRHARGTPNSLAAVEANDQIMSLEGWGYGATAYSSAPRTMVRGFAGGTWTDASQPAYMSFWTNDGGVVPAERMRIDEYGRIGIATTAPYSMLSIAGQVVGQNFIATSTSVDSNLGGVLIPGIYNTIQDPTGFTDFSTSTITFAKSTRTFTIAPTSLSYDYYINGVKYSSTTASSFVIPSTAGQLNYVYIDNATKALTQSSTIWDFNDVQIATVYWNGTDGLIGFDRHSTNMDWATHAYLHYTIGMRYEYGLTGTFTNSNTFALTTGAIDDEDNRDVVSATTTARILYRTAANGFTFDAIGTAYFRKDCNTNHLCYDNGTVPTDAGSNNYVNYWVFGTNDRNTFTYVIMGQTTGTLAAARAETPASLTLGTLPVPEMKLLYKVTLRDNATTYIETTDYRTVSTLASNNFTATAHSSLTGLDYASSGHTGFAGTDTANTFTLLNIFGDASTTQLTVDELFDSNGSPGTSGEILSSTVTGTDWIANTVGTVTSVGTTFPVLGGTITAAGTITWGGLSTSTAAVISNIPYFSSANQFANVATTTLTATAPLSLDQTVAKIGGSNAIISCATATNLIPGCISAASFLSFTNKIGTSSALSAASGLLYATGVNTAASVATSSAFDWTGLHTFANASTSKITVNYMFGNINAGDATSLEIPNAATSVATTTGSIFLDTTSGQLGLINGLTGTNATTTIPAYFYSSFSYATSTTWQGTTTLSLGIATVAETWKSIQCKTNASFLAVVPGDGTNAMNYSVSSTTVGTVYLNSNNSFTAGEERLVSIGTTTTSSAVRIGCTVSKQFDRD